MKQRTIIIIWKWLSFYEHKINDELLSTGQFKYLSQNIKKGKGKFYFEYDVAKSDHSQNAKVIISSIYNGVETRNVLYQLIKQYAFKDNNVLLFLHRGNHYKKKDVEEILNKNPNVDKCFLFADGRDFIYYNTKSKGLLDDTGRFKIGRDKNDNAVSVLDRDTKQINQPYFDNVWNYYEHEFKRKIFELCEDIFDELAEFLLPKKENHFPVQAIVEKVKTAEKCLYIRIKSFLEYYERDYSNGTVDFEEYDQIQDELEKLSQFEKEQNRSYIFDDCSANLEKQDTKEEKKISKTYSQLEKFMRPIFLPAKDANIDKEKLRKLRTHFQKLIEVIPGDFI